MQAMGNAARKELHELIDTLPDSAVEKVRDLIKERFEGEADDPVRRALDNAPIDDEPETPEEAAAVAEAREAIARGEVVSHDEMKRRLGL